MFGHGYELMQTHTLRHTHKGTHTFTNYVTNMSYREVKVAYCRKIYQLQQREIYGCKGSDFDILFNTHFVVLYLFVRNHHDFFRRSNYYMIYKCIRSLNTEDKILWDISFIRNVI